MPFQLTEVRLQGYRLPFVRPLLTAGGPIAAREGVVMWLRDGTGRWGVGEAAPLPGFGMEPLAETRRLLEAWARALPGRTCRPPARPGPDTPPALGLVEPPAAAPAALHGLECALLDLAAQHAGLPLADYLAPGAARQVAVNALLGAAPPADLARTAAERAAAGYGTLKLKLTGRDEPDVEAVAAVRAAVGAAVRLRLDANGAWSEPQAAAMLARLAPLDIEYVEQPLPAAEVEALARLAATSPIALAADESARTAGEVRRLLALRAAAVVVLKPMALGGPLATLALARLAAARGVPAVVTTTLDAAFARTAALHVAAVLAGGESAGASARAHGLATGDLLAGDLAPGVPGVVRGRLTVPREAGLGRIAPPPET